MLIPSLSKSDLFWIISLLYDLKVGHRSSNLSHIGRHLTVEWLSPPDNGLNRSDDAPERADCVPFTDDGLDCLHSPAAWRFGHAYGICSVGGPPLDI
jgi:hypothetical protein